MLPKVYLSSNLRKNMKPIALTLAVVMFSSGLGYDSMVAYGQTTDQPCSVSHPCVKICGDHPCAPGERYALSANSTTTVSSNTNNTNTNQTGASGMSANVKMMDNATVTKTSSNMTMKTNGTMSTTNMTMSINGTMTHTSTNTTMTTTPKIMMPKEQVASGTQPKDVKCQSGFELIINQFNSRPACVKSDVASLLVERGWGMLANSSP
jgi:uncharacterized protein (UPF0333 family)